MNVIHCRIWFKFNSSNQYKETRILYCITPWRWPRRAETCKDVSICNKHIEVHLLDIIILSLMKMHGKRSIKFVNAQQAKSIHHYRNTKEKLIKTNAAICRTRHMCRKYIHIQVKGNNARSSNTKQRAINDRLNLEIKFLYKKKQFRSVKPLVQFVSGVFPGGKAAGA
jgi:hypothetical protein